MGYIEIVVVVAVVGVDDNAVAVDHRGLRILARINVEVRDKVDDDHTRPSELAFEGVDADLS